MRTFRTINDLFWREQRHMLSRLAGSLMAFGIFALLLWVLIFKILPPLSKAFTELLVDLDRRHSVSGQPNASTDDPTV